MSKTALGIVPVIRERNIVLCAKSTEKACQKAAIFCEYGIGDAYP